MTVSVLGDQETYGRNASYGRKNLQGICVSYVLSDLLELRFISEMQWLETNGYCCFSILHIEQVAPDQDSCYLGGFLKEEKRK